MNEKASEWHRPHTASATAQRFSSTIEWAAAGSDNYWSAYPADGSDDKSSNR